MFGVGEDSEEMSHKSCRSVGEWVFLLTLSITEKGLKNGLGQTSTRGIFTLDSTPKKTSTD